MSGFELQALWELIPLLLGGLLLTALLSVLLQAPNPDQEPSSRRLDRRAIQPRRRENRPVTNDRRQQDRRLYI